MLKNSHKGMLRILDKERSVKVMVPVSKGDADRDDIPDDVLKAR